MTDACPPPARCCCGDEARSRDVAALALTAPGSADAAAAPGLLLPRGAPSSAVAARSRAAAALAGELGRFGVVDIDPRTARPRVVARLDGTLTGPRDAPPERIVLDYLREHADLFGDGGGLELARSYTTRGRVRGSCSSSAWTARCSTADWWRT